MTDNIFGYEESSGTYIGSNNEAIILIMYIIASLNFWIITW